MVGWGQVLRRLSNDEPLTTLNDSELLRLYLTEKCGDAFACLVRRHGNLVLRLCQRELLETSDAEDAFQATFLTMAQKARSIRMTENLAPWLAGVARRLARRLGQQLRRRKQRLAEAAKSMTPRQSTSVEPSWWDEERRHLPEEYQTVIDLCLIQGHSREEAALLLNQSPAAVHGLLYRARLKLKKQLLQRGAVAGASLVATQATAATVDRMAPVVAASAVQMLDRGLAAISSPTVAMLVNQRMHWLWLVPGMVTCAMVGGLVWWNGGAKQAAPTIMAISIVPSVPEPIIPPPQLRPDNAQSGDVTQPQTLVPAPQQSSPQQQVEPNQQARQQSSQAPFEPQQQKGQSQGTPFRIPVPPAGRLPSAMERSTLAQRLSSTASTLTESMLPLLPHVTKQMVQGMPLHISFITSEQEYRNCTEKLPPVKQQSKQQANVQFMPDPSWNGRAFDVDWKTEMLLVVVLEQVTASVTLSTLDQCWIPPDEGGVAHLLLQYAYAQADSDISPKSNANEPVARSYPYVMLKVPQKHLRQVAVTIWRPGTQPDGVGQVPGKVER